MSARAVDLEPAGSPAPVVRVAPMRRRHLRAVTRIEAQVYPRPWSVGLFLSELALRDQRTYLVARVGSTVVGYVGMLYVLEDAHVTTVAVDPAWHRLGIGTRLLAGVIRTAVARGSTAVTLEVRVSNVGAQALYRAFGFAPAGVRKGYYADTGEDAIVMWAHDVDDPDHAERVATLAAGVPGTTVWERS